MPVRRWPPGGPRRSTRTLDPVDEPRRPPLDPVGSGLPVGSPVRRTTSISASVSGAKRTRVETTSHRFALTCHQDDAGQARRDRPDSSRSICSASVASGRLAEDLPSRHDDRVGRQHWPAVRCLRRRPRLSPRHAQPRSRPEALVGEAASRRRPPARRRNEAGRRQAAPRAGERQRPGPGACVSRISIGRSVIPLQRPSPPASWRGDP